MLDEGTPSPPHRFALGCAPAMQHFIESFDKENTNEHSLADQDASKIQDMLFQSIVKNDLGTRKDFYTNTALSSGTHRSMRLESCMAS